MTTYSSNKDADKYTTNREPFKGSNTWGEWIRDVYAVYSYGYHFPIYVYDEQLGLWFGNKDKYSQSTAKQISQSRPSYDATILPKSELIEIMFSSSLGKLHDEERIVEANV